MSPRLAKKFTAWLDRKRAGMPADLFVKADRARCALHMLESNPRKLCDAMQQNARADLTAFIEAYASKS